MYQLSRDKYILGEDSHFRCTCVKSNCIRPLTEWYPVAFSLPEVEMGISLVMLVQVFKDLNFQTATALYKEILQKHGELVVARSCTKEPSECCSHL